MQVSAVIPTYNYGAYVVEAVKSALSQVGVSMEVIVVDDGSTDDTAERLQPYLDRINYVRQVNCGLSGARNTGIAKARGEWIALLDSDDIWHPGKTQLQLSAGLRAVPEARVIGSPSAARLPPNLDDDPIVNQLSPRDLLLRAKFGPSGVLIRRDCFDEVGGFDTELRAVEDRDMWLRLGMKFPVAQVLSPCWWYRTHVEQMNRDPIKMYLAYGRVLEKFFINYPDMSRYRGVAYAYYYQDAANAYRESGNSRRAFALAIKSLCSHPGPFNDAAIIGRFPRLKFLANTIFRKF